MTEHEAVLAWVGIGSNLDDPAGRVRAALDALAGLSAARLAARSSLYLNPPMGDPDQPDYVNAVAALETRLAPLEMLAALQEIETRHGRRRNGRRWEARVLDLDLLLHGDSVLASPELTLPHPGVPIRSFVLYPLAELSPGLVVPGHGRVDSLLAGVDCSGLRRIDRVASR
ncbi:MAG TPA: 2-amino-4-hydroxy-6-hydroxymethyldihydropteridine diphosphokinase [Gammaproteobacteria bacterium]|nr:2-amino-4-hydroxy-6-hydroxymethyldihydropteridine diphosphokinase [Gammaproteobacteria bacterium]